ncbi:MAG: transporter substrate-binding domain-containing protein [Pseudomonadales bacterium]|nr:transporter substrate-binding domain-containing protein [Pseudomonadales bacterium]
MALLNKILTAACLVAATTSAVADTISLRADSWYPYNATPGANKAGYMIDIATQAWKEAGHKIDYQLMDWDASLANTQSGEIDCVVGVLKSEAPNLIFPKQNMGLSDIAFFAKSFKYNWKFNGVSSFKNMSIGVVEDYNYSDDIDVYVAKNSKTDMVHVAKGEHPLSDLINLLEQGKIDLVLENPAVFKGQARKMKSRLKFEKMDSLGDAESIYIACSAKNKHSKDYVRLIDKKLKSLRKTNQLKPLLRRYGLRDWQK